MRAHANPNLADKEGVTALSEVATARDHRNDAKIMQLLIQAGADVNAPGYEGEAPVLAVNRAEKFKILVEAGANLFVTSKHAGSVIEHATVLGLPALQVVLEALTRFTKEERESVKNWLLVNQRLRHGLKQGNEYIEQPGMFLPKDPKMIVVKKIYEALPQDLLDRVVRAGGEAALKYLLYRETVGMGKPDMMQLLKNYLDLDFLEQLVRKQTKLPK